jgi:cAMP-dependent protein kinase regulator
MFDNKPKFGPEHHSAGTIIFQQGDEPDNFYIITRGIVEVLYQPPDSLDELIDALGPGDYFGEVGLMRHSRRMATVRAKTDVDLMVMDYQTFQGWIESSPFVAAEIDSVVEERLEVALELPEPLPDHEPIGMLRYLDKEGDSKEVSIEETAEQFKKGAVILKQGDPPDKFYIIIEGFVTVSYTMPDGRVQTIAHLTSGDYFGEIGLLEGTPRIATVTALTDVKLLSFDQEIFKSWMQKSPSSKDDIQREATRRRQDTGRLTGPLSDKARGQ